MVRDMTAPEVASVYDRARRLARETGRSVELFRTLWGSWLASLSSGDMRSATALKDELLVLAREQQSEELLLQAHHSGWTTALLRGDLRAGLSSIETGLPLYRRDAHGHHALLYGGHDPGACGHAFAGMILALRGRLDRARLEAVEAISLARSVAHHGSLGHAYQFASEIHYLRRDVMALDEIVREMLPFAAEHGSAVAVAHAKMVHGWVLIAGGHVTEGIAALRVGLAAFRRTGSKMFGAYKLSRAADGLLLADEIDEALSVLTEATALAAETGEHWSDAMLDWLLATAVLRRSSGPGDAGLAEVHFRRAIAASHESGAILIELRAVTSLARLMGEQGQRAEARELLAPIYGRLTEGFDTADLKQAGALLDELT
jgi:predicted ATPase